MSTYQSFRDFEVYQKARALAHRIWERTQTGGFSRDYGLKDQITRAADSIPSNFAEGFEREGTKEFIQFIGYAKGSSGEVRAQLDLAVDRGHISAQEHAILDQEAHDVAKMLTGLSGYLKQSEHRGLKFKQATANRKLETPRRQAAKGAAIISVLLVLTVLTIMVVAFLQSMRIDRLTARAYLNKTKAEMLARAAAEQAITQIIRNTRDPLTGESDLTYTVESAHPNTSAVASPDYSSYAPVTFISRYELDAGGGLRRRASPLVSTNVPELGFQSGNPSDFNTSLVALFSERSSGVKTTDVNSHGNIQSLATGIGSSFYKIALIEQTNGAGLVNGRLGFLVLDEQARINPVLHRSEPRDGFGKSAGEIPTTTGGVELLSSTELAALVAGPALPESPFAIGQYFTTTARANDRRHLFGFHRSINHDVIPAGYPDAGMPKYSINELATDPSFGSTATARAENIAQIINRNLPDFKKRDPSLASETTLQQERYLNRLAASVVDYIDTDTEITTVNGGEPAGRDLFPLVTAVAERVQWTSQSFNSITGQHQAELQTSVYLQIWNPYTVTVTGSANIVIRNRMRVHYGTGIVTPLFDYSGVPQNSITVRPNEFVVVEFPVRSQVFNSPTGPSAPRWVANSPAETADQTTHSPFEFEWNGQRVDMNRRAPVSPGAANAGMPRNSKNFVLNAPHYQCSFIPTNTNTPPYRFVGDPRANYLSNYEWATTSADASYATNTRWKGRQMDTNPRYQDFVLRWAARDYVRANPAFGNSPGNINATPASVTSPYVEATDGRNAPFYIRNGPMLSVAELGHVFDPIQADDVGNAPSGGSPSSIFVAGGGRTLRIGQPEYSFLDQVGRRSMQLLDLFSTNTPAAAGWHPQMQGRININTAPVEVLQALFYNIAIRSDEGFHNNNESLVSRITESKSRTLAEALVKIRRDEGHFQKISDLRRVLSMNESGSTNPAWNRAGAYEPQLGANTNSNTPPEVMDRAREELFAKIINLVDTQSRAFRIYSVGQALDPSGKVVARAHLETIITLDYSVDLSGKPVLKPKITHERYY